MSSISQYLMSCSKCMAYHIYSKNTHIQINAQPSDLKIKYTIMYTIVIIKKTTVISAHRPVITGGILINALGDYKKKYST